MAVATRLEAQHVRGLTRTQRLIGSQKIKRRRTAHETEEMQAIAARFWAEIEQTAKKRAQERAPIPFFLKETAGFFLVWVLAICLTIVLVGV
jgi:hypothetical protein